ncbi:MAG: signal peptide peptidase SppA [Treponema sp.]|nr:signal peptide peptidase SppA [Treponema sp.]
MENKKSRKGLVIFICLLAVVVLSVAGLTIYDHFSPYANTNSGISISFRGPRTSISIKGTNKKNSVTVISVNGTIAAANSTYNQQWILSAIESAKNSSNNVALVLSINSPGGAVYETDEVYLALQDYKTTGRPVYAYFNQMAASGGYYMACAADKIYANRNTITGSIGVISGQFIDLTQLFQDYGIDYRTIHAGKNKNMGNYNEKITQEQINIMQSVADECYEQFALIVSKGRNIPYNEVKNLADGRIYTAKQALLNGLIDQISTFDEMMDALEEELGVEIKPVYLSYARKQTFVESLMGLASKADKEASALDKLFAEIKDFDQYPAYLYRP